MKIVSAILAVMAIGFAAVGLFATDPFLGMSIGSRVTVLISAASIGLNAFTFYLISES